MEEAAPESSSHTKKDEEHDQSKEPERDEEKEWEAYLRSQWSRKGFAQYYRCRPMSLLGKEIAADYDDGNRVVMSQSALDRLSSVKVEYPMVFKIQNAATRQASHVGVQEFVAEEGFVHVPTHTMARLGLHNGGEDDVGGQLVLLTSTSLPKATSVKLQPHTADFLKVKYPKELLEYNFGKYTCMTVGDTITVIEGDKRYLLDVVEAKPEDAVSTIETDCEVDFLPPLDYKEPAPVPAPAVAKINVGQCEGRIAGVGVRMDGKPVEWQSYAEVIVGPGETRSVSFRHPQMGSAAGPSAKGGNNKNVLRFGGGASSVPATGKAGKNADDNEAKRFTGKKYPLED